MPDYDGFKMDYLLGDINFEIATYKLLEESEVPVSRLLYSRLPVQRTGPHTDVPTDLAGRCLMLFEKVDGRDNVWHALSTDARVGFSPITPSHGNC